MIQIEDIYRAKKDYEQQFEATIERMQGVLLAKDYTDSAAVRTRPGFVWYRQLGDSGSAAQALCRRLSPIPALPVILQRIKPNESWEVVDVDTQTISRLDGYAGASFDKHASEHEPGGSDPLYVYLRMITPLRTTPQTGLKVNVAPLVYDDAGTLATFGGYNNFDLSASVPGSGLARYVLVYLDQSTNGLDTVNGATTVDGGAISPPLPVAPVNSIPSAYVRLAYGQTTITESDIVDARLLLNSISDGGYLTATGTRAGATAQAQDFGANGIKTDALAESTAAAGISLANVARIANDTGILFESAGGLTKAGLNWADANNYLEQYYYAALVLSMINDDTITVEDSGAATVLEFDPATGVLSTDGLDSVAGSGIAVADDLLLAQAKDITLQGASGGPQSGTARAVLAGIGHILDGGHPSNPYPATRNADDAEFNNSTQAENNTIGTHAGGDFWEWSPGAASSVSINSTTASHLFVSKFTGDAATPRFLRGAIVPPGTNTTAAFQVVVKSSGLYFTSSFYFGIRIYDSNTGYYLRSRLNCAAGTITIINSYDVGGGETTVSTISNITPDFGIFSIRLDRLISTTVFHRAFYDFSGPATGASARMSSSNTTATPANLLPDEVWLEFDNSGAALQQFNIDSVRRVA